MKKQPTLKKNRNQRVVTVALFRSNSAPETISDPEFGDIRLRRNAKAKFVRLRLSETGVVTITMPRFASTRHAFDLLESSRGKIREWKRKYVQHSPVFQNGDTIGRSHTLKFTATKGGRIEVKTSGLTIQVMYPDTLFPHDVRVQSALKPALEKALQKEARAYLPRRLSYLAEAHGFQYARVRYGTQMGRWGSCSSRGTISLNVGLMLLEPELIDYVLVHELCHTKQMNHSTKFWAMVESFLPDYKTRRKLLKTKSPSL